MKWIHLGKDKFTCVDDEDYEKFHNVNFHIDSFGYAVSGQKGNKKLHQMIMGERPSKNLVIDHINRNPLDNRRCNLRWITYSENRINNSQVGICFSKKKNLYVVQKTRDYERIFYKEYQTEHDALVALDAVNIVIKKIFGDTAIKSELVEIPSPTEKEMIEAIEYKIANADRIKKEQSERTGKILKDRYAKNPVPFGRHAKKSP